MESPPRQPWLKRLYGEVQLKQWQDWRWQLKHRLRDAEMLRSVFDLTPEEEDGLGRMKQGLPLGITPYYASLFAEEGPDHPLRKTMLPRSAEFEVQPWERRDPLGEEDHSPLPGLVHTYPDKVLFLVTDFCAVFCRYCTRARMVGAGEFLPDFSMWERNIDYIREHTEIRDVLLSGGDPLVLSDERLGKLLRELAAIDHVEILRIGTKIPAVLPQRITENLCRLLSDVHPLWMSVHFTHASELTGEVATACDRLSRAGIPLMSQTVLLKEVNDTPEAMRALNQGLLRIRVKPYYLHQCDTILGIEHFKTPVETGRNILRSLHGWTTGYAVPHLMIDAPGGGGKIPVAMNAEEHRAGHDLLLKNYRGETYRYPDPEPPATDSRS